MAVEKCALLTQSKRGLKIWQGLMGMELITRKTVAEKLAAHLRHELSLDSVVAWAESALMDGEFDPAHLPTIRDVVARIGVADVRASGLTWEDCEHLLAQLGYSAHVSIVPGSVHHPRPIFLKHKP